MRLRAVELEGFRSFREFERVELEGVTFAAIVGANHQGKSSLVNAIEFALYARSPGSVVQAAISRGASKVTVTVEFDHAGGTYRITRTRTRKGAHEVYVSVADPDSDSGWQALTEKYSKSGADPFIVRLLGMDSTVARATWLIGQGDFGAFCDLDPAPRRAALSSAFGLDDYIPLAKMAEQKKRDAQLAHDKAAYDLGSLKDRKVHLEEGGSAFEGVSDDGLTEQIKAAEAEVDSLAVRLGALVVPEELTARANEAQRALSDFDAAHAREVNHHQQNVARVERALTEAREYLKQATTSREAAEEAVWEVDDAAAQVEKASADVAAAEEQIEQIRAQVAQVEAERAGLAAEQRAIKVAAEELAERVRPLELSVEKGEGECFTCKQSLTGEHAHDLIAEQQRLKESLADSYREKGSRIVALGGQRDTLNANAAGLEGGLRQLRAAERAADQAHGDVQRVAESAALWSDRESTMKVKVAALEDEFLNVGAEPKVDSVRRNELAVAAERASEAVQQATAGAAEGAESQEALKVRREELRAQIGTLWREQTRREQTANDLAALVQPLKDAQAAVERHSKDLVSYKALYEAWRPTGIPAMILAGVIEELNEEANDILHTMGANLGVVVTSQKETQRGTSQDKVMIYAMTGSEMSDYSTLSGQEKVFVALALRLGLSACIARRTGSPIETIILDEGWGALDESSKRALKSALERISRQFSVFTITHIEDVKAGFPTVIRVDASSGTSRVEVTSQ